MQHAPIESPAPRSSLPGALLAAYLAALVYASLYPATGWRAVGLPSFAFLFDAWPRYWTGFDVATNVAVYFVPAALGQAGSQRLFVTGSAINCRAVIKCPGNMGYPAVSVFN